MVRYDDGRKSWYSEFEQAGERVFKRFPKGLTRAQAEAWETRKRREIFDRVGLEKRPDITIGEAIDLWLQDNRRKNQRGAASEAKQWEAWRGKLLKDAPEVAAEARKQWSKLRGVGSGSASSTEPGTRRRDRVPRASTINRRLMLLKAVCKRAWRHKLTPDNLSGRIETLREPAHKDIYLTRAQVTALASSAPTAESRAAIWLLSYSGLRASELLSLPGIRAGQTTLVVEQSKTGKPRLVPVSPLCRSYLAALPLELSYWELRKQFIVARKKSKLPATVTLHTLRHTCASWLINAGVDLYTVGKILGHTSTQTTMRYAHLSTQSLEKAMARLK